jgi:hypothetical protein
MKTIYKGIIAIALAAASCSTEKRVDEPTERVYVIDNATFGIHSDRTNARSTNDGINDAIKKAKKEGYNIIRFSPGEYLLVADNHSLGYVRRGGIFVPNNITLDLTGATFYIEPNGYTGYSLFRLDMVENVTITGGRLVGDREEHDYTTVQSSHEWGTGITILCSKNITVQNVTIEQMTGDAILAGFTMVAPNERRLCENIRILECDMGHCRRQGISIIHARNMEIAYNRIHDIGGTDPGCGIDIEPDSNAPDEDPWFSLVDHVNIHHNDIRDTYAEGLCFVNRRTSDITATDNYLENAGIVMNRQPARIRIERNTLMGWASYMVALKGVIDVYMPLEGPNGNTMEFPIRANNCSTQTGYFTETDNFTECI